MRYCKRCLQPDTRPNTRFGDDGVCPACTYFAALSEVDWAERVDILRDILAGRKRKPGQQHDCIIGISGGKDSTRQALWVRDQLGVRPLLVCLSYPPEQVTQRGVDNLSNLIELGFDVVVSAPAPGTWRQLKRDGFARFTNSFRSTELALFSCVPQIALRYGIDLILWGENPALQLGDLKALGRTGYDGNNLRHMNTLSSGKEWMLGHGYREGELIAYTYPSVEEFLEADLNIIYLGWFLGDWSLVNNAMYACPHGLAIRTDGVEKTGDLYGITALDEDFTPINQMIKYYKFGFGRTTDYVNEEIRLGRISRDEAIGVVERYDHCCSPQYIEAYCQYLGISVDEFWEQVRASVNPALFCIDQDGQIYRRFKVGEGL
ncbi:MAG: N-acetyl sugar amidotransferase [Betaproteobacteria bacterium]|nr:N-acetyl sugar amidotransferase [Betaproteobacteria bacterium]